ncbi:hypothetical protein AWC04_01190 [Mycolicibacterium fallax]|uniref:Facilitated glucose transporter n=1 Tax=Mycolicibacterium fallax TaxID=1793 RepID=A0A1X1RMG4_MYCFA|nr:hypothetical protein [Mycolicibacterium fallax]ORV09700.1 hypothetical protein AWC04_01190 [Mycolicibacterium fallax]HOW93814.1 hypothetical protein [Mycolicibacterium fallax]
MGHRLACRDARQHPDLTARNPASGRSHALFLGLLGLDGVLVAVLGAFFLPAYLGQMPFPISALAVGLANLALVWAAAQRVTGRQVLVPLLTFLLTIVVFTFGGPGNDVVFGGPGVLAAGPLLLIALGCAPAMWWLWRRGAWN